MKLPVIAPRDPVQLGINVSALSANHSAGRGSACECVSLLASKELLNSSRKVNVLIRDHTSSVPACRTEVYLSMEVVLQGASSGSGGTPKFSVRAEPKR